ncbi:AzlD domain-containing protein [Companilactobacillus hulinensis]|uniref:AzlD domain-containing protein n=1 Tax=Companilactobacillus hulinensis TaxID=2486007 RepID=UPI000F7A7B31|nr:AzlD domain-containing protein [Companilactobacillus hulinensis]
MISKSVLLILIGSALVTWIPRITPFILGKMVKFPAIVTRFLEYLPLSILCALLLETVFSAKTGTIPTPKWDVVLALIPTVITAVWLKDLMKTVIVGIVAMALVRLVI